MFLAREGPVHDVADALFLARSVWEAGIRDVRRAEDHAEVGIDRPVSPVADFRNLRIWSAITREERDELRQLRRENKRLRMEQEILKKAAAWFARESNSIPERGSSS